MFYSKATIMKRSQVIVKRLVPTSTWMGDRQGTLGAVSRCPFVGVDLNM